MTKKPKGKIEGNLVIIPAERTKEDHESILQSLADKPVKSKINNAYTANENIEVTYNFNHESALSLANICSAMVFNEGREGEILDKWYVVRALALDKPLSKREKLLTAAYFDLGMMVGRILSEDEVDLLAASAKDNLKKRLDDLAAARKRSRESRKEAKTRNHEIVKGVLHDLYGPHRKDVNGWKMNYDEVADYMVRRRVGGYKSHSNLKKLVKKYAPAIKDKYK